MRLVVFEQYRRASLGALQRDGRILDLSAAAAAWLALVRGDPLWKQEVELRLPPDIGMYLAGGVPSRMLAGSALEYAEAKQDEKGINGEPLFVNSTEVRLMRPLLSPLVISPGATFRDAPNDGGQERKRHREFFIRNPFNIQPPGAQISLPAWLGDAFDAAPRLAVVLGHQLHRATAAEVNEAVFGYCPAIEIRARQIEKISWAGALFHVQYPHARAYDGSLTLGAMVVSKHQVSSVESLIARLMVGGRTAYRGAVPGRWGELLDWVSSLSERVTLRPGTLLIPGGDEDTFVQAQSGELAVELAHEELVSAGRIEHDCAITLEIEHVGGLQIQVTATTR